jgi:hypothetical protein
MKVTLNSHRIKLHNRRVYSAIGRDGKIWLSWVRLVGRERVETSVRLTPETAAATASVILAALEEIVAGKPLETARRSESPRRRTENFQLKT